ncbi:MAG: phosphoribosylformylglycinamidine synthase [Eubacteriales bacterium]|nr:phosphoribosylformylglycinamidine synthase [Eubacteriales bacterium]
MVSRIYVEKKREFASDAESLKKEVSETLGVSNIEDIRIIHRYDVEGIDSELFAQVTGTVFAEPPVDEVYDDLKVDEGDRVFAVEYLPGQFDQRANSAAECIQLISKGKRPDVRTATLYVLKGDISDEELDAIKKYVINPVDAREATLDTFETLEQKFEIPTEVETLDGFREFSEDQLDEFLKKNGLAMDLADLKFCQDYFKEEQRDPTITEIKVIDTYWSDHCRHTTFNTTLDHVKFADKEIQDAYDEYINIRKELGRTKPVNLMDIGTIAAKYLKKTGQLTKLDESEEINACTVKMTIEVDGVPEDWLLLFKNETHNHPTEIEPFGGAATCIGGAIRDPLSGRSYVYGAMRVTGAGDPLVPVSETLEGKLPQRKLVRGAADGYSSYGNQIGLATGQVDEIYHPGYVAKRMEVGAVIAAAPAENVRRERPEPGDVVILLGGRTGRDGIGGATGSSKKHTSESLETCGAEVQKGNAPEERKLQRLFRNPEASKMIKRCNDFGAGGVSVAIGELADGLDIDLNKVTKKYEGLDGTELAISESQERMAVCVAPEDEERFCEIAHNENLEATKVAVVTEKPYLVENWNGKAIVNISRAFLDTDGVEKHVDADVAPEQPITKDISGDFKKDYLAMASDLNCCSKRGLSEEFDSTIGAGTVLMPFGGIYQRTPTQALVDLISVEKGHTDDCSLMAYGFDPYVSSASPFKGAYLAVVNSVAKLIATGASFEDVYLSVQEFFGSPNKDPEKWGKPLAAVLGALKAEIGLGVAAIGGKDSMSGTFNDLDVPPTLISFAVTTAKADDIISPEFKHAGDKLILIEPDLDEEGLPTTESLKKIFKSVNMLIAEDMAEAVYTVGFGGISEAVMKMAMGNGFGFKYNDDVKEEDLFKYNYGSFLVEVPADEKLEGSHVTEIGYVTDDSSFTWNDASISCEELFGAYESKLEPVYKCNIETAPNKAETFTYDVEEKGEERAKYHGPDLGGAKPKALIPVFPGTNCEYETAKAFADAGAEPDVFVLNNLTPEDVSESVKIFAEKIRQSQIIFVPGGFSAGDEPDGSGKFITSFFRNPEIKDAVNDLLENRDGLMAGICNGFQALIKLGLVPYGKIVDQDTDSPTLTFNEIRRHQSMLVRTRVASNKSPWMAYTKPDEVFTVPISHGEGRFIASEEEIKELAANGQILTQYVDVRGSVSNDINDNPNGSFYAIEGITSPDGRVIGKMGHSERIGSKLYKNVPGIFDMRMFEAAVDYFRK